ncbi:MAG: hypothetical protein LBS46_06960 [Dysgonamonadaceae bacterium]|jgi:hypothetical protein|nr:hypothetical protein [Dysgonamonadaceae bacterium]
MNDNIKISSDDILYLDCVEKIVELYRQYPNGSIFYSSSMGFIDETGTLLYRRTQKLDSWLRLLDYGNIYYYEGDALAGFRIWENTKFFKDL